MNAPIDGRVGVLETIESTAAAAAQKTPCLSASINDTSHTAPRRSKHMPASHANPIEKNGESLVAVLLCVRDLLHEANVVGFIG